MKMFELILTVVAVALLMAPARSQDGVNPSRNQQIEASTKKIKQLEQERIATLKEFLGSVINLQKRGLASYDEVLEAKELLLEAELAAAESGSDRIAIRQKIVDVLTEYQDVADAMAKSTGGFKSSVLKIRVRRLDAEIDLEQARLKAAEENR